MFAREHINEISISRTVAPWENEEGEIDDEMRDAYETNRSIILAPHREGTLQHRYNLPLNGTFQLSRIVELLRRIYEAQQFAFR